MYQALVAIESGRVIGGRLPPNALRMVRQWVLLSPVSFFLRHNRGRVAFRPCDRGGRYDGWASQEPEVFRRVLLQLGAL